MSDADDTADKDTGKDASPTGGELLADARRTLNIPIADIAKELHLDEYKVRALEANDFDVLGAPVFAKGHLRKYAQLVQVSEKDVMADYYQLNRSAGAPPVLTPRPRPRREMAPGPWIALIIVLVAAAAAYWWIGARSTVQQEPVNDVELAPPEPTQEATTTLPAVPTEVDNAAPDDAVDEPAAEVPTVAETTPAPVEDAGPEQMQMSIAYSGDCWTEITDANGRRLFFGLGASGRTVNLSGDAPFNVLFGNVANVSLEVNGAPYTITPEFRRGRTARLTISGS